MKTSDHVIFSLVWGGDFCCFHCGERLKFSRILPCSLTIVAAASKTFAKEHRRCKLHEFGENLKAEHKAASDALRKLAEAPA